MPEAAEHCVLLFHSCEKIRKVDSLSLDHEIIVIASPLCAKHEKTDQKLASSSVDLEWKNLGWKTFCKQVITMKILGSLLHCEPNLKIDLRLNWHMICLLKLTYLFVKNYALPKICFWLWNFYAKDFPHSELHKYLSYGSSRLLWCKFDGRKSEIRNDD